MLSVLAEPATWSPSQRRLRGVVLVGPVVALLGLASTGDQAPAWLTVAVVALAARWAWRPESPSGILALGLVLVAWALGAGTSVVPAGALVASGALMLAHLAALVASYGPAQAPVGAPVLRRWAVRALLLAAPAPAIGVVTLALDDEAAPATVWVTGLAVVLVAALAVSVVLRAGGGAQVGSGRGTGPSSLGSGPWSGPTRSSWRRS